MLKSNIVQINRNATGTCVQILSRSGGVDTTNIDTVGRESAVKIHPQNRIIIIGISGDVGVDVCAAGTYIQIHRSITGSVALIAAAYQVEGSTAIVQAIRGILAFPENDTGNSPGGICAGFVAHIDISATSILV